MSTKILREAYNAALSRSPSSGFAFRPGSRESRAEFAGSSLLFPPRLFSGQRVMRKPANDRHRRGNNFRGAITARAQAKQFTFLNVSLATCVAARRHGAPAVQGRRLWRLPGPRGLHQRAAGGVRGFSREVSVNA